MSCLGADVGVARALDLAPCLSDGPSASPWAPREHCWAGGKPWGQVEQGRDGARAVWLLALSFRDTFCSLRILGFWTMRHRETPPHQVHSVLSLKMSGSHPSAATQWL